MAAPLPCYAVRRSASVKAARVQPAVNPQQVRHHVVNFPLYTLSLARVLTLVKLSEQYGNFGFMPQQVGPRIGGPIMAEIAALHAPAAELPA